MATLLLQIDSGERAGERLPVGVRGIRLGRSSRNDLHFPDEKLSRNHCLFQEEADGALRLTDLASANGTFVNGEMLGGEPQVLQAGDCIEVGDVRLRVVDPAASAAPPMREAAVPPASVDLGLDAPPLEELVSVPVEPPKRRVSIVLEALVLAAVAGVVAYLWINLDSEEGAPVSAVVAEPKDELVELAYEKVDADSESIFRYAVTYADGRLAVQLDDLPKEKRHVRKEVALKETARARLEEIVSDARLRELDDEYAGPESEPPGLHSRVLKVVRSGRARTIRCVNAVEPESFVLLREQLEAFSKAELGVWAMGYSRVQLLELAATSAETGRVKWEDREVEYGNVFAAAAAYREAIFYLETVNPKPPAFEGYKVALRKAEDELKRRYGDQRFRADRAINLGDWTAAQRELQVLLEMVPDRTDGRYREASAKLMDVEKRLKKGGRP